MNTMTVADHWCDMCHEYRARAEAAEAEVARLQDRIKELAGALGLASAFVAKANADGAYSNTTMTGERTLAIISDALGGYQ